MGKKKELHVVTPACTAHNHLLIHMSLWEQSDRSFEKFALISGS